MLLSEANYLDAAKNNKSRLPDTDRLKWVSGKACFLRYTVIKETRKELYTYQQHRLE